MSAAEIATKKRHQNKIWHFDFDEYLDFAFRILVFTFRKCKL